MVDRGLLPVQSRSRLCRHALFPFVAGNWMCRTHAALIDRDVDRFPVDLLKSSKPEAEHRAMKLVGRPLGGAAGKIAAASSAVRVSAEAAVIVKGEHIPHNHISDPHKEVPVRLGLFSAFVVQFLIPEKLHVKEVACQPSSRRRTRNNRVPKS